MTIPTYETLMASVLRQLLDRREHPVKEVAANLAAERGLTDEELARMVPAGR